MRWLLILVPALVFAEDMSVSAIKQRTREYAHDRAESIKGMTEQNTNIVNAHEAKNQTGHLQGYYNPNGKENASFSQSADKMANKQVSKLTDIVKDEASEEGEETFSAMSLITKNINRREEEIKLLQPNSFAKALDIEKHPEKYDKEYGIHQMISGKYDDCHSKAPEEVFDTQTHICNRHIDIANQSCSVGKHIEVDAQHKYQCEHNRKIVTKECNQQLIVGCNNEESACAAWGLITESVSSNDIEAVYDTQNHNFHIGVVADNNWGGVCKIFDRQVKFKIQDKNKIENFMLKYIGYDDHVLIKLNGHQIYIGPKRGQKLEVKCDKYKKFFSRRRLREQFIETVNNNNNGVLSHLFYVFYYL